MCQASSAPLAFFSLKAKIAAPFFIASAFSSSEALREEAMSSKAAEEGKASTELC